MMTAKSYRCSEPCSVFSPSGKKFNLDGDIIVVSKNYTGTTKRYSTIYAADFSPIAFDEDLKLAFISPKLEAIAFTATPNIDSLVSAAKLIEI